MAALTEDLSSAFGEVASQNQGLKSHKASPSTESEPGTPTQRPEALIGDEPLMGLRVLTTTEPLAMLASWLLGCWALSSSLISVKGNVPQDHPRLIIAKLI